VNSIHGKLRIRGSLLVRRDQSVNLNQEEIGLRLKFFGLLVRDYDPEYQQLGEKSLYKKHGREPY
jgi:hypothetical protein